MGAIWVEFYLKYENGLNGLIYKYNWEWHVTRKWPYYTKLCNLSASTKDVTVDRSEIKNNLSKVEVGKCQ